MARRRTSKDTISTRIHRKDELSSQPTASFPVITDSAVKAAMLASLPEIAANGAAPAKTIPTKRKGIKASSSDDGPAKELERIREPRPAAVVKAESRTETEQLERHDRMVELRRKVLVISAITLSVLVLAVVLIYPVAQQYYQTYRTNQKLEAQAAALDARNTQLQSNIDYLNTDEGIEDQAREYGYVIPGENAVSVTGANDAGTATTVPEDVVVEDIEAPHTWLTNILDPFFGVE